SLGGGFSRKETGRHSSMAATEVRVHERYAWHGQSLLITNDRGDCTEDDALTGFYFREARYLRTLCLLVNGESPWLCETAATSPTRLDFMYVHPEITRPDTQSK